MKVAFFGGSFDPPHIGHVLAASYALCLGFKRVLVPVVHSHAFSKPLSPFAMRVELARLAFAHLPQVEVSDVEALLPKPSFTLHTLRHVLQQHPDWQLRLIAGSDVAPDFDKWFGFEEIQSLARPLLLGRGGYDSREVSPEATGVTLPAISSTEARKHLLGRATDPSASAWLQTHVPAAVLEHIEQHNLYRSG